MLINRALITPITVTVTQYVDGRYMNMELRCIIIIQSKEFIYKPVKYSYIVPTLQTGSLTVENQFDW